MDLITLILVGFVAFCGTPVVAPAKILVVYPVAHRSHFGAFRPLLEELAKRGHQITAYTAFSELKSFENFHHKRIHVPGNTGGAANLSIYRFKSAMYYIHNRWRFLTPQMEAGLQSKELQALMQSEEHFDLMIVEALFVQESVLAFAHKFNVPVVNIVQTFPDPWIAHLAGIPHSFSYIPHTLLPHTDHMNFWQRTKNALFGTYMILAGNFYYLPTQERIMRKYVNYRGSENLPPLRELISNISIHMAASHYLMTSVRPYSPNIIEIAGIGAKPAGKLPQDLQLFCDGATDGFIYVSFGSFGDLRMFPAQFQNVLIETLKGIKKRVVMKWNETIQAAPHIITRPWLPQNEILAHPNCKLFITHGGFHSLMEAMMAGIPTIGIPIFSDQWHNVAWYVEKGVGLELNPVTETVAGLTEKINRIIHTPSFTENAKHLAALYRDEPRSRLDNAVYWVEYVIRHKGAHHLKPASVKMPYYQYLLLDVIAFLVAAFSLVAYIIYLCARKFINFFSSKNYVSKTKKQK